MAIKSDNQMKQLIAYIWKYTTVAQQQLPLLGRCSHYISILYPDLKLFENNLNNYIPFYQHKAFETMKYTNIFKLKSTVFCVIWKDPNVSGENTTMFRVKFSQTISQQKQAEISVICSSRSAYFLLLLISCFDPEDGNHILPRNVGLSPK
jgi:hypothetical protein